jgi:RNA polymerase sigma-70 factor (ECF subfamily)
VNLQTEDFAEIVRANQSLVFSLAYHFLHDRSAAEETAQEVFLDLYGNLAKIESAEHLVFWLRRVTCHRCLDFVRRRAREKHVSLDEVPEAAAPTAWDDPLLSRRLQQLVASLPEKARLVVTLRFQEDLDPSEIARILEMPVNTVKSHLHRALNLLEEKLGQLEKRYESARK